MGYALLAEIEKLYKEANKNKEKENKSSKATQDTNQKNNK